MHAPVLYGSRLSAPGTIEDEPLMQAGARKTSGTASARPARLIRGALLAAAGLAVALGGCTSTGVRTATTTQAKSWAWCDNVQQSHPTVLCFQQ